MRMRWRAAACLALSGVLVLFLAEAGFVRAAAAEALSLCARSVIPALFPFLVVSSLLLSLGLGELLSPMLAGLMEPLFRVDGVGSSALLLGLVGGYPIGAKTAADLYRGGRLSRPEAERLLAFCNNSNPVFLISVLGVGVFGSVRAGVWLWLIHLLSALLTGLLFRNHGGPARRQAGGTAAFQAVSLSAAFVAAVRESLSGMLSVCAFVTFFYVLARPLASLGGWLGPVLVGLTELFSLTPLLRPDRFGFILASAMAGWGGLSVLCQTAAVLEGSGLRLQSCAAGKAVQGLLAGLLAALLAGYALS
ncbi:MAG: sporulation protein [Clostridiales bacterium]|nr:sporulation protein [Clostridiales bacterium]